MSGKINTWVLSLVMVVWASVILPGGSFAGQNPPGTIEIRVVPFAEVMGNDFTLGEIAEMDGFEPALLRQLASIPVGKSPLPGKMVGVTESWLRSRLRDWRGGTLNIIVPPGARVVRAAQRIPARELERLVIKQAAADATVPPGGNLKQYMLGKINDVLLPKGQVHWELTPVGKHLTVGGNRSYRIVARVNNQEAWEGYARVRQQVISDVVVAAKPIRRGQVLAKGDLKLEKKNLSTNTGDPYIDKLDSAYGKQALRPIGRGESLREGVLTKPVDIAEGGKVTLVYQTGLLTLRTPGVAMVKGKAGQFIPVRNLQSGKIVYGTLHGNESVRVD